MFVDAKANGEVQVSTVKANLLKAANLLEQHGHSQHMFNDAYGRICMAEAILRAVVGRDEKIVQGPYYVAMNLRLIPEFKALGGITAVCDFNNSHTKEQCIARFREAANSIAG